MLNLEKSSTVEKDNISHLKKFFTRLATMQSLEAGYKRGHGITDHTILVANRSEHFAELQKLEPNERFAYFVGGLGHDIIQPEQTPIGSDMEKSMQKSWDYQGQGEDINEEQESGRFVDWYLNQDSVKEKMEEYGVVLSDELIERIVQGIKNTAGKPDFETDTFVKQDGERVKFSELDNLEQAIILGDKMSGAEPSLIFDGLAKQISLQHVAEDEGNMTKQVIDKMKFFYNKRTEFFVMLKKAIKQEGAGIATILPEGEINRLNSNLEIQGDFIDELEDNLEHGEGPALEIYNLISQLNQEKIEEGDSRGIDGWTAIKEWYTLEREQEGNNLVKKIIIALKQQPEFIERFMQK